MASSGSPAKLLDFMSEASCEQEKLCEIVRRELELYGEPEKLVLDAVQGNFFGESTSKRSCVLLLEQLASLRPRISPAVKADAASLARRWRLEIGGKGHNGVLEVMGFCLLLGAYDLVDEFDGGEISSVLRSIDGRAGDHEVADTDPVGICLESQEKAAERSLAEDVEFVNQIASAFTDPFDALKSFCIGMDGKNLKLFLYHYVEDHNSWSDATRDALSHASDPAKLVLGAIPGFLRTQPEFQKSLSIVKNRKCSILLLEQLLILSPPISPDVRDEALKIADDWGSNLGQLYQPPLIVYGFLLFVAIYGCKSKYEDDELLRLLGIASQYTTTPGLCRALGLADKSQCVIKSLIHKAMLLEAVDNVFAYNLTEKFEPTRLLRGYLTYSKKRIYKKLGKSGLKKNTTIDKEITSVRTVINYIIKHKLESSYPLKDLEEQIVKLEIEKVQTNDTTPLKKTKAQKTKTKLSSASNIPISKDTDERSPNDVLGKDIQASSQVHEEDALKSSSSPFFVDMDGQVLRHFLYDHLNDHDSLCSEVSGTIERNSDPAKLVLNSIPRCLYQSDPEVDKSVMMNKLRKRVILLLEKLLTMCPNISPNLKKDAQNMAHKWMAYTRQKCKSTPLNAYALMHFIAAYELVSCYKAEELFGILTMANEHKVSPGLCQSLDLTEKIVVLINNLVKKTLIVEAIEHIYAFKLVDLFPPAKLLKDYMESSKKRTRKIGAKFPSNKVLKKEIAAAKNVMICIAKHNLDWEYPLADVEQHIAHLERQKMRRKDSKKLLSSQLQKMRRKDSKKLLSSQ